MTESFEKYEGEVVVASGLDRSTLSSPDPHQVGRVTRSQFGA
jgi:hypothetical protein